jgi:hypothetical protein
MKTCNRWLLVGLAFAASIGLGKPSSAQGSMSQGLAAQSAKVAELERAGKCAEAIPLAQAMLANQEKGSPNRDLGGALNNLAQLYGDVGRDAEAEPLFKRAPAIYEKAAGRENPAVATLLNNLGQG